MSTATEADPQSRRRLRRTSRKTTLLSTMSPAAQRAFLQEQLDQQAMFRQITAAKNGVPGPIVRNMIQDDSTEIVNEYVMEASGPGPTGISAEELLRREELARREGEVAMMARLQQEKTATPTNTNTVSPADIKRAEELARREGELAAKQKQLEADQAAALEAAATRDTEFEDQVDAFAKLRETARAGDEAARDAKLREAQAEVDRLRNQPQPTPIPTQVTPQTQPAEKTMWQKYGVPVVAGAVLSAGGLGAAGWATGLFDKDKPPVQLPGQVAPSEPGTQSPAVPQVPTTPATPAVPAVPAVPVAQQQEPPATSDQDTLLLLQSRGLSAPRTPLGEAINSAFELDPTLREDVMRRVEKTLKQEKERLQQQGPGK